MLTRRLPVVVAAALLLIGCLAAAPGAAAAAGASAPEQPFRPGAWAAPLAGQLKVTRPYRPPDVRWGAGHRGVDLAAAAAAEVRAAGAGRISFAGRLAGRGVVAVVHGALRTTYEPVDASVRVGEVVARGDPIGHLGAGHDAARPARYVLHWGLRRGDTYLDPMSVLGGRPVRLLPRWRAGPSPGAVAPPKAGAAGPARAASTARPATGRPADARAARAGGRGQSWWRRRGSPGDAGTATAAAAVWAGVAATMAGRRRRSRARAALPG
jgi:hypothetical protein